MLDKIASVIHVALIAFVVILLFALAKENKSLREQLEEPCNCTQVCEIMFEEMGC